MGFIERPIWAATNFSAALDLTLATLRADPVLGPGVRTWQVWDGGDDDLRGIEWDDLPAVRITPSLGPSEWQDESSHRFPLRLRIDLFQRGTRAQHMLDFWGAIVNALFPTSPGTLNDLYSATGVFRRTASGPVPEAKGFGGTNTGLTATGVIEMQVRFDT